MSDESFQSACLASAYQARNGCSTSACRSQMPGRRPGVRRRGDAHPGAGGVGGDLTSPCFWCRHKKPGRLHAAPVPLRLAPTFSVVARPLHRPLFADVPAGAQYSSLTQPQLRSNLPVCLPAFQEGMSTRRVVASYNSRHFLVSHYLFWNLVSINLVTIDSLINFCYES